MEIDHPDNPPPVPYVACEGRWVPLSSVDFIDIEEAFDGRDLVTFKHKGKILKSFVISKHGN